MRHDPIPAKPGHVVTAAVWQFDKDRNFMRLRQVCYEPRKRREREPDQPSAPRRQALLL